MTPAAKTRRVDVDMSAWFEIYKKIKAAKYVWTPPAKTRRVSDLSTL